MAVDTWIVNHPFKRAQVESEELDGRIASLESFVESERFRRIPYRQQSLMLSQYHAMLEYSCLLQERMKYLASIPLNN